MVMALEAKIHRLILQATRGCKEGKHGKNVQLILDASPHSLAGSSGAGSHSAHELTLTLGEPWGCSPTFSTAAGDRIIPVCASQPPWETVGDEHPKNEATSRTTRSWEILTQPNPTVCTGRVTSSGR